MTVERDAPIDPKTIKRISPTRFDIPKATATTIEEDIHLIHRNMEYAPVVHAGAVRGLRLFNVESDSLCAALGLQNEDVLLDIEGRTVGSLDLYDAMRLLVGTPQFTIHVERKHKRIAITYVVR